MTPKLTPDSSETGPVLAGLMEGFRRAGEQTAAAMRERYAPLFALTAGLAEAQEVIERDSRWARQRENAREFRRAVARASSGRRA